MVKLVKFIKYVTFFLKLKFKFALQTLKTLQTFYLIKKSPAKNYFHGTSLKNKLNSYFHDPAGGNIECDFSHALSHEPAGGKIECDFSLASFHDPAGGNIE